MTGMDTLSGDEIARLVYLSLLVVALAGFFVASRAALGQLMRGLLTWVLIFVVAIVGYGLWDDIGRELVPRQAVLEGGQVSLPRQPDGHFYLTLDVNDVPVRFVVDTGATEMVLSREDSARVGIDPDNLAYLGRAFTANGEVRTARVRLDEVALGQMVDRGVRASVNGGQLNISLLGMSYLDRFERIEIADGEMRLIR